MFSIRDNSAPAIVGVIFSPADLRRALAMRAIPDFFEVRLDALAPRIEEATSDIAKLKAPLIITARHPSEGGQNALSLRERRALLSQFLPQATYMDIELRSARYLAALIEEARTRSIGIIISFHDFDRTPTSARLERIAREASSWNADVVKIATRTDTLEQLARLRDFLQRHRSMERIVVLGIGRLGAKARIEFATKGSAFAYGHLGKAQIAGQLSLTEVERLLTENNVRGSRADLSIT